MLEKIKNYFQDFNYDVRLTHDARFIDQKVTPDVLSIIADCVVNYVNDKGDDSIEFTTNDIWNYDYSNENVKNIFNKPDVLDESARSEYDKFFQQPLKALSYAKILSCTRRGKRNFFKIINKEILTFISVKERNALDFLIIYLEKVLRDSNIWTIFENFWTHNDRVYYDTLKYGYDKFILENTRIRKKTEIHRHFTKVINPLAYHLRKHGTKGGRFSDNIIDYADLMYNRRNWRDIMKLRNETREQYEQRAMAAIRVMTEAYAEYTIQRAKRLVRDFHYPNSEVHDEFAGDTANHVHHIFMPGAFPQLQAYVENLILLTANQHLTHAHPNNDTHRINREYQLICLTSKSESIEKAINDGSMIYSKDDFLFVIQTGLNLELSGSISFHEIRERLARQYNET